ELGRDRLELGQGHLVLAPRGVLPEAAEAAGEVAAVRDLHDAVDRALLDEALEEPRAAPGVVRGGHDRERLHEEPPSRPPSSPETLWAAIRLAAPANEARTPVK